MAQIFPEELSSFSNLSSGSKTVYRLLEQNLSDEWECHAAFSGNNIVQFIIISPDLGVLVLCISDCSSDQFDSFFNNIPQIQQQHLDAVRQQLQKENQLCNEDKSLKFPVGFGLIFTELSSDYANSAEVGKLSGFALFSDELRDMIYSPTDLENRLFDMVEENDFYELDDVELQLISNNIPLIHNVLQGEDIDGNIKQSSTDRDQDMNENRGIEPFINHLEFLDYECRKKDKRYMDKVDVNALDKDSNVHTLCCHQIKSNISIFLYDELPIIVTRFQLHDGESKVADRKSELLHAINELNNSIVIACCYLDENNGVVIKAVPSIPYSKIAFGRFIELFQIDTKEILNAIAEILEGEYEITELSVITADDLG